MILYFCFAFWKYVSVEFLVLPNIWVFNFVYCTGAWVRFIYFVQVCYPILQYRQYFVLLFIKRLCRPCCMKNKIYIGRWWALFVQRYFSLNVYYLYVGCLDRVQCCLVEKDLLIDILEKYVPVCMNIRIYV